MSLHIVIDGYNFIYQSKGLISQKGTLEEQREKLIELLISYKKIKSHKITVVFDGTNAPSFLLDPVSTKGIKIKFSQKGEIADVLIKRISKRDGAKVVIVSSDNDIVNYATSQGSSTINSEEFAKKIISVKFQGSNSEMLFEKLLDEEEKVWPGHTKKKGASRKLSKKERKNKLKTDKL